MSSLCSRFSAKVLFLLPKLHGEFKTQCLEIILSRVDAIEDVFLQLKNSNILDILTYRYQTLSLSLHTPTMR